MGFLDSWFAPPDVASLSKLGDVKGLVGALKYKKDAAIRKESAEALGAQFNFNVKIHLADLSVRMIGLQNVAPENRKKVVADSLSPLVEKNPSKALSALAAALDDADAGVRASAAEAIGKMWCKAGNLKNSLGTTIRWFPPEEFSRFERSVVAARSGTSFLNALLRCLQDSDESVRRAAVLALQETRESAALSALSAVAEKDPNTEIRQAAKWAIEKIQPANR